MKSHDLIRVRHMVDSAREGVSFIAGRARFDLDANRMLTLSLVRCAEAVGEAAAQVTDETRRAFPGVPWSAIVGMRNRLTRAHFEVDLDRLWDTCIDDLPNLIIQLDELIKKAG